MFSFCVHCFKLQLFVRGTERWPQYLINHMIGVLRPLLRGASNNIRKTYEYFGFLELTKFEHVLFTFQDDVLIMFPYDFESETLLMRDPIDYVLYDFEFKTLIM
jgi:hypothetical protein